ncbi:hypothetical protein ALP94_02135 [Pseudomonas savastanoi pv. glycinea]|nr:hypothetical protein ALP94_02135 [Pseudomonas savastanoi pv. glycinea]
MSRIGQAASTSQPSGAFICRAQPMNSFEESIIAAAQEATPNNTEAEREQAKVAAIEAVAQIMQTTTGLQRTLALAALLDSYSESDLEDE